MWYNSSMDGQEYLDQISARNRRVASSSNKLLSSKFFWVGLIGAGLFALLLIIGSILGKGNGGEKNRCFELSTRLKNVSELITEYQPNVRSSELRSSSASLYGVLTNTDSELTQYVTEKYKVKDIAKGLDKKSAEQAEADRNELNDELFKAKINGILDRTYANKMAYEISILMAEEDELYNKTKDSTLTDILEKSSNSLENLYDKFDNFSEVK